MDPSIHCVLHFEIFLGETSISLFTLTCHSLNSKGIALTERTSSNRYIRKSPVLFGICLYIFSLFKVLFVWLQALFFPGVLSQFFPPALLPASSSGSPRAHHRPPFALCAWPPRSPVSHSYSRRIAFPSRCCLLFLLTERSVFPIHSAYLQTN